jgi:hypothetical protein
VAVKRAIGIATVLVSAVAWPAPALAARSVAVGPAIIRDGPARFEVLTPTLVRLEYAQDGRFEDRPTMTAIERRLPIARYVTRLVGGERVIRTAELLLSYRRGTGPFTAQNLSLALMPAGRRATLHPSFAPGASAGNLGGWRRSLDLVSAPVPLHDGLLSRAGWDMLDDTATVVLTSGSPGFAVRPAHVGAYQDGYLFAYGHDYARGFADLRALTGPAPLLPRSAFGVWFSRYWPYREQEYHDLVARFRAEAVPLDTLSVDTDFKRESDPIGAAVAAAVAGAPGMPYAWDGWEWNTSLFPDPQRFVEWAHDEGLALTFNVHPSISSHDPQWQATQDRSGGLRSSSGTCRVLIADATAQCGVFDWTNPRQLDAYFALHAPFERQGVDFWWLDWCCDDSGAIAPGLTADTFINSRYAAREHARGLRWPAFSRIGASYQLGNDGTGGAGAFAEHRYTMHFTGDTCATWEMLAFEAQFSVAEGNIGLPYVSHDIGSFHGQPLGGQCGQVGTSRLSAHLPDDLYVRWVQLGAFQPLLRLHSDHGDRLPWEYGAVAHKATADILRLREALVPYVYTLARETYDTGLPIVRGLYLQWPELEGAYGSRSEYTVGKDLLVVPVASPGDPATTTVWFPPGEWVDLFTGQRHRGPGSETLSVPLARMPVFASAGAVVVTQPEVSHTPPGPASALIATAYPGGRGAFALYDDQGVGFGYQRRAFTRTPLVHVQRGGRSELTIGPARGAFVGALSARAWELRFPGVPAPRRVTINGRSLKRMPIASGLGWSYDTAARTLHVLTGQAPTGRRLDVVAA